MSITFGMRSARDCLEDFRAKVSRYRDNDLDESLAMECAIAGWSIVDWVFDQHVQDSRWTNKERRKAFFELQKTVKTECASLDLLQDIANARKHRTIEHYPRTVLIARKHGGAFDNSFSRDFDISRLVLETRDQEFDFEDTVVSALEYWDRYFAQNGIG